MLNLHEANPNLDLNTVFLPQEYFTNNGIVCKPYYFDKKVDKLVDTNILISVSKDIKQTKEYIDFFYKDHWNEVESACLSLEEQVNKYDMNFVFSDKYKIPLKDVPNGLEKSKTKCKLIKEDFNQLSILRDSLNKFKVDKHSVGKFKKKYEAIYDWWELNYSIYKVVHILNTLDRIYEDKLSETEFKENYLTNVNTRFSYRLSLEEFNPKSSYGEITPIDQFILKANFDKLKEYKKDFKQFILNFQNWIIKTYYEPF